MANPDQDRKTGIDADQISDGAIGPYELATTNEGIGSAEPNADEVLHGHSETGEERKLKFKRAEAINVDTDTTNFDGKLTPLDDTVQKALDTLDDALGEIFDDVRQVLFRPERVNEYITYKVLKFGPGGTSKFTFMIPENAENILSIQFVFVPDAEIEEETIDLEANYGSVGEPSDMHNESATDVLIEGDKATF